MSFDHDGNPRRSFERDIRDMIDDADVAVDWCRVTEAQMALLKRIGTTCDYPHDPIALLLIGMSTLHSAGVTMNELFILCAALAKRIERAPEGLTAGHEFVAALRKETDGN
jgi:hypothetical protein